MGNVNFYLKKAEETTGRSLIVLQFKYGGNRLVYSFGQSVDPKNWNVNKQRVKSNKETTADGDHSLNDLLDNLQKVCEKAYKEEMKNGTPTPEMLRAYLIAFINKNDSHKPEGPTLFNLIDRFIAGEILSRQGKEKSPATIKNYRTTKGHLEAFEKQYRTRLDFNSITLDFFYKYVAFLKKPKLEGGQGLAINSIGKDINTLKVFMGEAADLGYTTNYQFRLKKFMVSDVPTDAVYLTEKEILKIYKHDFSSNEKLDRTRDLFVFGCFIGLRYSDYSDIKPENIVQIEGEYFIKMITKKTKELVIIPCNPIILEIFDKYEANKNRLPHSISGQKFNDYVKDVCRDAKLTETGRLLTDPKKELCDCVSSHTARRSFATNYYLQGFPTIDLMKITGHRTESAFLNYIRVSKLDTAKRFNEHIKKNWSSMMMKVAS